MGVRARTRRLAMAIAAAMLAAVAAPSAASAERNTDLSPPNPYELERDPALRTHGWVALGIGGAMLAAGGVTGGLALHFDAELSRDCSAGSCPPARHGDLDRIDYLSKSSTVLLISGAAASIVGLLVLTVFAPEIERPPEREDGEVAAARLLPEWSGDSLRWRF
ncbi:MAG: hypothetical protein R6V85_09335 [Polyangia bacterium]